MKKPYQRVWLFAAILLFAFAGNGCGQKDQEVLVLLKGQADPSYDELKTAAEQWAGKENVSIQIVAPKLSSVYEQQKTLENSIKDRKWDLVVVEALDEGGLYPILDYAKSQGSVTVSMQGMSGEVADYTIQSCDYGELGAVMKDALPEKYDQQESFSTLVPYQEYEGVYWDRRKLLLVSLEVGNRAAKGEMESDQEVITTKIEGYRTLHLMGNGVYCGKDILAAGKQEKEE